MTPIQILLIFVGVIAGVGILTVIGFTISGYVSHRRIADFFMSFEEFHTYYRKDNKPWKFLYGLPSYERDREKYDIGFDFIDWIKYKLWHFIVTKQKEKEEKLTKREKNEKKFYESIEKEEKKNENDLVVRIYDALSVMEKKHEKPNKIILSLRAFREMKQDYGIIPTGSTKISMYGVPISISKDLPDSVDFVIEKEKVPERLPNPYTSQHH